MKNNDDKLFNFCIDELEEVIRKDDKRLRKILKDPLENLREIIQFPDLMKIFNKETDELSYSKFLAWLIDPIKDHNLGKSFLKEILLKIITSEIEAEELTVGELEVETEKHFEGLSDGREKDGNSQQNERGEETDNSGRFDILVDGEKLLLILENKIKADFSSEDQLKKQRKYVENNAKGRRTIKIFLYSKYLTPDADAKINEAKNSGFTLFSYKDIAQILTKMIEKKICSNINITYLLSCYLSSLYRNIIYPKAVEKLETSKLSLIDLYEIEEELKEEKMRLINGIGYKYCKWIRILDEIDRKYLIPFLEELTKKMGNKPEGWELKKVKTSDEWYYEKQLGDNSTYIKLYFGFYPVEKDTTPKFYTAIYSNHSNWKKKIKEIRKLLGEKKPKAREKYLNETITVYLDIIDIKENDYRFFDECLKKLKEAFDIIKEDEVINKL